MEGNTLPAGSQVTVTKTQDSQGNLLFVIGVPQGPKGEQGVQGEQGIQGPQGVSVTGATVNESGDLVITLSAGDPINAGSVIGPQGIQGDVGPTGASVDRIERTSGTGAPGTTDTYTVYLTNGQTGGTFQVYNGSNGTGSGDFMADGSVPMTGNLQMGGHKITNLAEPTDNTDAASKEYVDDTITVSLVGNYIPMGQKGQANGVASLDDSGKVPSAQLPPMDYVPTSRTVNGHALSADVTLDAEDVGARPNTWTPSAEDVGAIPNPTGGTAGQVLTKTDTGEEWADAPDGLPTGGTPGQLLTKTETGEEWANAPSGLPEGGTEGQMLYQGANGAEWGIPPYLGSMPQLDYSQMKSLHDLGITDLNDILEPGTYVGMSNFGGYPEIANVPDFAFGLDAFFLNVYKFVDPTDSTKIVLSQTIYPIVRSDNINSGTGELGGFYRQALGNTSGAWVPWSKVMEAQHISFTPTSTLTSENVQDAIEEVDTQLSTKLTTPTGGAAGQILTKTATGAEWGDPPAAGGSLLTISFDEAFEGLPYTLTGGGESYSGTVPASLEAVHSLLAIETQYILTVTNSTEEESYTRTIQTLDYFTALEVSIAPFAATITVTCPAGSAVTCVNGSTNLQQTATSGTAIFTVGNTGTWTITATLGDETASGEVVISADGEQKSITLSYFSATITVNTDAGASVTCVKGDDTQTKTATGGTAVFTVTEAGTYTVTSTSGDNVKSDTVVISADGDAKTVALYFSLSDYSPAEIAAISEAGKAAEYFQTGDTIDIQLSGIGTMTLEIADFDHDYLAGNTSAEKAGISFITKDLLYSTYQMNTSGNNVGGFPDSKLCETLSTTIWNAIPAEWRNVIKTVYKWYGTGNDTNNGEWFGSKIWVPLEYEMFGTTTYSPATEHSTGNARKYPIFTNNNSRIKKMNNGAGSAQRYWEASPDAGFAQAFCHVRRDGDAGADFDGVARGAHGVFFGLAV